MSIALVISITTFIITIVTPNNNILIKREGWAYFIVVLDKRNDYYI